MNKGLLIVDGNKNTLLIPWNDLEFSNIIQQNIGKTKQHKTFAELDKDIRLYVKGEYTDEKI